MDGWKMLEDYFLFGGPAYFPGIMLVLERVTIEMTAVFWEDDRLKRPTGSRLASWCHVVRNVFFQKTDNLSILHIQNSYNRGFLKPINHNVSGFLGVGQEYDFTYKFYITVPPCSSQHGIASIKYWNSSGRFFTKLLSIVDFQQLDFFGKVYQWSLFTQFANPKPLNP